jgi:para-nitrobenzyl esterase
VTYRLDPLGFLAHPELTAESPDKVSGNYGLFVRQPLEPDACKKGIEVRYGPFADRFLKAYPGDTKGQTYTSSADMTHDSGFGWASWTWARLPSRTGNSKVFMYYFDQKQPEMPNMPFKLRGASHAAEIKYVFKNLDETRFSPYDIKLSDIMASYWTNFAKNGDPNRDDLPVWPQFTEQEPVHMYLDSNPAPGPVPNLDKLELYEEFYKYRRESEDKAD